MTKAFDIVFQKEVDAVIVAKTSYCIYGKRFRYRCLCCGEEVNLVAVDSTDRTPYFKHKRGNNDIVCEYYLGQPGAIESCIAIRRKGNLAHIVFGFNKNQMTFEMGLVLTDEEIDTYYQRQAKLCLHTGYCTSPFFNVSISRGVIKANVLNYYTITEYSNDYYVSLEGDNVKLLYSDIIKRGCKLNIYRTNQQDEHYRKLTSELIYTDMEYIAISENENNIRELLGLSDVEVEEKEFSFATMGRIFYALKFVVKKINYEGKKFFQSHDYQIETSELLEILWPPVYFADTALVTTTDDIYITSSFKLIPNGNINIGENKVEEKDEGIYKISIDTKVTIYEKNVDMSIVKTDILCHDYLRREPDIISLNKFCVPEEYDYYLFSKDGCVHLTAGSNVYLTKDDMIIGYLNGLTKVYIRGIPEEKISLEKRICDILKYHPQAEPFNSDDFMNIETNEIILNYLETCYRTGIINSTVKRYIEEKRF